jgi:cytochrome c551/c552
MDFIYKLILPESMATLNLLMYLLLLSKIFVFSYSGVLFASTVLSLLNLNKQKNNQSGVNLSLEFINVGAYNKLTPIGLGVLPFASTLMILIQMLHHAQPMMLDYMLIALIFYVGSIALLYIYRASVNSDAKGSGIAGFIGWISASLMLISLYLLSGIFSGLEEIRSWEANNTFTELFFNLHSIFHILKYMIFSFSFASILLIYKLRLSDKFEKSTFTNINSIAFKGWIVFLLLTLIDFFTLLVNTLKFPMVILSILISAGMIIQIQLMIFNSVKFEYKKSVYVFSLALLLFSLINIIDHSSFAVASGMQFKSLAANYEKVEEEYNAKISASSAKTSGKEIYASKCMACHSFDRKMVGPPHKQVLVKYAENKAGMVKFILKPTKVDPDYPSMPQQGLTPSEAKAVVDYMYKEYGEKLK